MISTDYDLFLIFLYNLHGFLIGCSFYIGKASKHWNWARVHMWKPRAISCDQSNVGFYVHNTSPCEIIFKTLKARNHLFLFVLLQSKVFFFLILFFFFVFSYIPLNQQPIRESWWVSWSYFLFESVACCRSIWVWII